MLYSLDSRPDIVAITETRLSFNSISNLDIPNYNFFHAATAAMVIIVDLFLILTSIGHITMELPLFLSLRRKYGRLFHWSLRNYVTTASLNLSA